MSNEVVGLGVGVGCWCGLLVWGVGFGCWCGLLVWVLSVSAFIAVLIPAFDAKYVNSVFAFVLCFASVSC